jgi:integrase
VRSADRSPRSQRKLAGRPPGPRRTAWPGAFLRLRADFRFHDLRHYFASLLIASGLDIKVVQSQLRHGSAKVTLDTYGHLWPDADESARAAVDAIFAAQTASSAENPADSVRTVSPLVR